MRTLGTYKTSISRSTTSKTMVALRRIKTERGSALSNYRNANPERKTWGNNNSMLVLA